MKKIGGATGRGNGEKVLRSVVSKLISTDLLSTISWTGKSSIGKESKVRFSGYAGIIQLIADVCMAADSKMDHDTIVHLLKYKIIKYAYKFSPTLVVPPGPSGSPLPPAPQTSTVIISTNTQPSQTHTYQPYHSTQYEQTAHSSYSDQIHSNVAYYSGASNWPYAPTYSDSNSNSSYTVL